MLLSMWLVVAFWLPVRCILGAMWQPSYMTRLLPSARITPTGWISSAKQQVRNYTFIYHNIWMAFPLIVCPESDQHSSYESLSSHRAHHFAWQLAQINASNWKERPHAIILQCLSLLIYVMEWTVTFFQGYDEHPSCKRPFLRWGDCHATTTSPTKLSEKMRLKNVFSPGHPRNLKQRLIWDIYSPLV